MAVELPWQNPAVHTQGGIRTGNLEKALGAQGDGDYPAADRIAAAALICPQDGPAQLLLFNMSSQTSP